MSTEHLKSTPFEQSSSTSKLNASSELSAGLDTELSIEEQRLRQQYIRQQTLIVDFLEREFGNELPSLSTSAKAVILRLTKEVQRICEKSDRIQRSGDVDSWLITLAQHRLDKCLSYYKLGSRQGRVELHSILSSMVYRHITPGRGQFGFHARYNLIEDFLQNFYIEVLKNFRKENELPLDYQPRTRLELSEYMAFSEQYAKRRITLPGRRNQQLVVLRAQAFSQRQPIETSMDIEMAVESGRGEEAEQYSRSPIVQQVREQMVEDAIDPSDSVLRDRVTTELVKYLEDQGQSDCVDYLVLKLQDLSAPEIDEVLNLTPRQRDYLQQRFKYHVEKFACSSHWQMVHQWIGADLDQNLGMPQYQWESFLAGLKPQQRKLLELKQQQLGDRQPVDHKSGDRNGSDSIRLSDQDIAKVLHCTPKQVQRGWVRLLNAAWKFRNTAMGEE
ncbi:MAG: HetZ-related protein [Merismopedia sp. SIO2A8]|nr:HetZ-related protein [Merismopedia sp. SIO2A8]